MIEDVEIFYKQVSVKSQRDNTFVIFSGALSNGWQT